MRSLAVGSTAPEAEYLGRNFNPVQYTANDPRGFALGQVLDMQRIQSNTPWSPFGRALTTVDAPEAYVRAGSTRPFNQTIQAMGEKAYGDSITLKADAEVFGAKLGFTHKQYSSSIEKSYVYRSIHGYKLRYLGWDIDQETDYEFFLSRRFVRDLKRLTAAELVNKYGTHVVTAYSLGAFQDLSVIVNSSYFSQEDALDIHGSLFGSKLSGGRNASQKASTHRTQLAIVYQQAGSDYTPPRPFLVPTVLFKNDIDITPLDPAAFQSQIRPNNPDFFELEGENVAIPDLISSLPLKVKYLAGIMDLARPERERSSNYVLVDPTTFALVKDGGKHLSIYLSDYRDGQVRIYRGDNPFATVNDPESSRQPTVWQASIDEDGLWQFRELHSQRYLCRDLQIRTIAQDTQGLRRWALNPIIPSAKNRAIGLAGLLIKSN